MRTIGILGGMSWESTLEYYRLINQAVAESLGGLHSAPILLHSFEFQEIADMQRKDDWSGLGTRLAEAGSGLERAGAECLLIATNTMHVVAPAVREASSVPLLDIVEATGEEAVRRGYSRVGLLGTRFTMERDIYHTVFSERFGVTVDIPPDEEREFVHRVIFEELCRGEFRPESLARYVEIIGGLAGGGAEAVVLGCTEIPLLVRPQDSPLPLLDTTALHARAAATFCLGEEVAGT
ncbi:aspartate/glutamate racemase family protein [Desulfohalovibrio reitneri]|uniref:aspartate/glutamate racemase family protein n=1 Tax=Desulfohalovibrio reitneri TaxID=1307759 RepID=UPI0004A6E206|nr:aspartate/glutamate racemase family protein [Desulfohalovibrio reitneri]